MELQRADEARRVEVEPAQSWGGTRGPTGNQGDVEMTLKWLPNAATPGTQRSHPVQTPSTTSSASTRAILRDFREQAGNVETGRPLDISPGFQEVAQAARYTHRGISSQPKASGNVNGHAPRGAVIKVNNQEKGSGTPSPIDPSTRISEETAGQPRTPIPRKSGKRRTYAYRIPSDRIKVTDGRPNFVNPPEDIVRGPRELSGARRPRLLPAQSADGSHSWFRRAFKATVRRLQGVKRFIRRDA
ncbi:hypothetical protein BC629DRAFT_1596967 [Irpex lacteus]|nr:hypothetical protein BC629DRAFT_1596967 [Irpex lacteus]